MKKLKPSFPNKWLVVIACLAWPALSAHAAGHFELTKSLKSASGGVDLTGGPFALNFSWGEAAASQLMTYSSTSVDSGYYGGRFGAGQTFSVQSVQVGGSPVYFQNGLQIGVTIQASVDFVFLDQLDPTSIATGIKGIILQDHLAHSQNQTVPLVWDYDPVGNLLKVKPAAHWEGNTVYEISVIPGLVSASGYALNASSATSFLTMADPHEENVIVNALLDPAASSPGLGSSAGSPPFKLEVPSESLSDYSVLLFQSSLTSRLDPGIVEEATRKSRESGGAYQTPLRYIEIEAYNAQGQRLQTLSQPAQMRVNYGGTSDWVADAPVPVHVSSLALWTLDSQHRLWVKIPASMTAGQTVSAPVTRLSVFALMGSALAQARDVFVFPNPWRPFGPHAGNGPGQTGTEQEGMTFNSVPSECVIKIYTLDGRLVRELRHSDVTGPVNQEVWDGKTSHGESAASGVYLWRIESEEDGKNGKLMIIR